MHPDQVPTAIVVGAAVLVPASLIAHFAGGETLAFFLSAGAVVPLSGLLGEATEQLSAHGGPRVGGLLNATLGNAAELIIGLLLVRRGELQVVKSSITGSVLGNLLLVLGAAFAAAGVRHREIRFSAAAVGTQTATMAIAVAGLLLPTVYEGTARTTTFRLEAVSAGVAVVLVVVYLLSLVYSFTARSTDVPPSSGAGERPRWSLRQALVALVVAGILVALESELLVAGLEGAVKTLGLSRLWIGLILVPLVGNAAEHVTAVTVALRGNADLALNIAVGSAAQVALLVTPVLVLAGLAFGQQLTLSFTVFEVGAIALSVAVVSLITLDGVSNWLEGAQLLGLYLIVAVSSFFLSKP